MTAKDCPSTPVSGPAPGRGGLPPWGRQVLLLSAGGLLADVALHGLQGGGSWLGLGTLAGGWLWLAGRQVSHTLPRRPTTVDAWSERCRSVLDQFNRLEGAPEAQQLRSDALANLLAQKERDHLLLGLVSSCPPSGDRLPAFERALQGPRALRLLVSEPLPSNSSSWQWSETFASCDALIFHLRPPLMAAELRWLESLPEGLPLWLLMETGPHPSPESCLADLRSQWPGARDGRILPWSGEAPELGASLATLSQWLRQDATQLAQGTLCRCLEQLHGHWQADLERLRRARWRQLQQRTQWLVAAGVLVTPGLSLDLLVLTVANGLMLRDMARLWECPWTLDQLKVAAQEVGKAALGLGVVEWSSQALASAFRLHGYTWLVGGAVQALSAAYLTRVIGHAMADLLARSVGVSEPDLQAIKAEAPLLVARAAEAERLDWAAFLQEAGRWLRQQQQGPQGPPQLQAERA